MKTDAEVTQIVADAVARAKIEGASEAHFARRREKPTPDLNDMFQRPFGVAKPEIAQDAKPARTRLSAVRPNAGIAAAYQRKIDAMIHQMQVSYLHWIRACYRRNEPEMAMDAVPAAELAKTIRQLGRRWQRKFNEQAPELQKWFLQRVGRRSDDALRAILREAGYSVRFTITPAMRDVMRATVEEGVGLIKSIPQQFHNDVQGLVMRSVQSGRDLAQLTDDLEARFPITRRRAKWIAVDQNNKATSALQTVRQLDMGIAKGIWQHSHAGKEPRPTHLANDGKDFNLADGWFDPDPKVRRFIRPGELINCRCTWRPVVKGFS